MHKQILQQVLKNEIIRLGLILCAFTFAVALILAIGNLATAGRIEALNEKMQDDARKEVLTEAIEFSEVPIEGLGAGDFQDVKSIYAGKKDDQIVGYCVNVTPKGYGGAINMIVGINNEGKVSGIKISKNQETPGLGTKADEPKFKNQFAGKNTDSPLEVIKNGVPKDHQIVAISGATITSNAVTKGVNEAIKAVNEQVAK